MVGAGPGTSPFFAAGKAYLAGPYKGAPLSFAVITPAVAGPFDLGTIVVRNALYLDPATAQVTVKSDPLPQILDGIPAAAALAHVRPRPAQLHPQPDRLQPDVGQRHDHQQPTAPRASPTPAASRSAAARTSASNRP